ncbi:DEKNAAC105562 [Brettanomyces naardenensis]|uniref:DEKNAAC105562 n=1 Tax=Brettanomyces naardenensis TaxID=13370 RepID=A0A448YTP2_BRENA|nr:DEKNAAC105562 [Brettanomyces naardenensis]
MSLNQRLRSTGASVSSSSYTTDTSQSYETASTGGGELDNISDLDSIPDTESGLSNHATETKSLSTERDGNPSLASTSTSSTTSRRETQPVALETYHASSMKSERNPSIVSFGSEEYADVAKTETHASASKKLSRMLTNSGDLEEQARIAEEKGIPVPPMGGNRPYPPMLPDSEAYTVSFDGKGDPLHPYNWPLRAKVAQCAIIASDTLCIAFGSAVFAEAIPSLSSIYHIADVVATLGVTLYVFGFATGPIIWAPLSELYGRRPVLLMSSFLFTVFNFAVACSDRLEAILICRFFAGCLGAAPMVVVPASFADMFDNKTRGKAIVVFSMAVVIGPMMAPFIGAFIDVNPHLGWRWIEFITGILAAVACIFVVIFERETHHPIILIDRAREIRRRTGIWGVHASHEEFSLTMKEIAEKNLTRPLRMLFTEPILFSITLYNSFIYGMMYLFLTAYPIVFQNGYHMPPGTAELPYIALIIGQLTGGLFCLNYEKVYNKKLDMNDGRIIPENRLPPMLWGAVAFPIGVLWFCWTGNYPDKIHWIVPTISGIFTGFGAMVIFIPSMNYIVDSYLVFSASAMAANTFLRSSFGGAFPLFAEFMFLNMGTNWAGLLLGLFAIFLVIFPILFMKYGKQIRNKSKFAIHED